MTRSNDDTKRNFSPASNSFLIDTGLPVRVRCLRCKDWCKAMLLPEFTMYYCTSIFCTNILELRHMADGTWELHDYAAQVEKLLANDLQELMAKPHVQAIIQQPKGFIPRIVK